MTTSPQPTPEAIEAGARAYLADPGYFKDKIASALTAALPAIRAEVLAEVAEAIEAEAKTFPRDSMVQVGFTSSRDIVRALANTTPAAKEAGS